MLIGKFPFEPDDKNNIFDIITKKDFEDNYSQNCKCIPELKDLVCQLIVKDIILSAKEALKHSDL